MHVNIRIVIGHKIVHIMSIEKKSFSRRDFVKSLSIFGVAGLGASTVLSACGGGDSGASADPCGDLTGLTEQEKQTRNLFQYVAETPNPAQRCDNCEFWIDDAFESPCGGCTLFKGPVAPAGWCNSWVAMSS